MFFKDISGKRFGRLIAIRFVDSVRPNGRPGPARWLCRCDCGGERIIRGDVLRSGFSNSCGCVQRELSRERAKTKPPRLLHGDAAGLKAAEYRIWICMIARCEDRNNQLYGGRGIKICKRWRVGDGTRTGYEIFLSDLGRRPSIYHSVDRINSNGNYEPSNVRWADKKAQSRNTSRNLWLEYKGQKMIAIEAAERFGVPYATLLFRLRHGWSTSDAIERPVRTYLTAD